MHALCFTLGLAWLAGPAPGQDCVSTLRVEVRSAGLALAEARVSAAGAVRATDSAGITVIAATPGPLRIVVSKVGFLEASIAVDSLECGERTVAIELLPRPAVEEEVTVVATTRSGRRLEDQPTRVEVLDREEIEEKMLMTPGDIVMMLNEMGGLRVQTTSPSIGAASVRVQGMQGRYTRFLSDGLPLHGQQVGGLGLLQIPPMDLGQVEVVKGVASALYGAGAMGGVVNLISRQPGETSERELLVNRSTLAATDAVIFLSSRRRTGWSASLLGGGHWQTQRDLDEDGWADLASYARGTGRARFFWEGKTGRSAFLTAGVTREDRQGGTLAGAALPETGQAFVEALDTRRYDMGGSAQTIVAGRYVISVRGAAARRQRDHLFGDVRERDRLENVFAELAARGSAGRHTWVLGLALEHDAFRPSDVPERAYTYTVPGLFAQDDVDLRSWLALSLSARADLHSEYGAFLSPRLAALVRTEGWTGRLSAGGGFFASTPLTEETEAAGLSRLSIPRPLLAERGLSVSVDLTRSVGAGAYTLTLFASRVADPLQVERDTAYALGNLSAASTNMGAELLATWRRAPFAVTASYGYVRSREVVAAREQDAALTPRHSAGLVAMWESEQSGRVGLECYYTGAQRLEQNPYRGESRPYVILGALVERRFGRVRVFLNAENLTGVRQTRWEPLLRPKQGVDGRWAVDAWAPLDGRVFNGGLRLEF